MANLKNGTLNYFLTKDLDALENRENALKEMNKMDPTYPDPNDPRFTDPAPVFTILDNLLCRDGVSIGKVYNNKTGKVVEITETTETGFKYQDTEEDALINKDNSIAVVEKLTGLKGEVVSKPNNIITYEASAKLGETTATSKAGGLHVNCFKGANDTILTVTKHEFENGVGTIEFDGDVVIIMPCAFYQCNFTSIKLPETVTDIQGIYRGHSYLCGAFANCRSLTSITIPDSVTTIGENCFNNCNSLTSVVIGDGITLIDSDAFGLNNYLQPQVGCSNLVSVTIKATTPPTLGTATGGSVFNGTSEDMKIYVPAASVDTYKVASGWSNYASRIQAISNS